MCVQSCVRVINYAYIYTRIKRRDDRARPLPCHTHQEWFFPLFRLCIMNISLRILLSPVAPPTLAALPLQEYSVSRFDIAEPAGAALLLASPPLRAVRAPRVLFCHNTNTTSSSPSPARFSMRSPLSRSARRYGSLKIGRKFPPGERHRENEHKRGPRSPRVGALGARSADRRRMMDCA